MTHLFLKTLTSLKPVIQKLFEPAEKLSNFLAYVPIAAVMTLFLAALFIAIIYVKKAKACRQ